MDVSQKFGCKLDYVRWKGSVFTADSDAILTKGIIALLLRVYSNQTPKRHTGFRTFFYR